MSKEQFLKENLKPGEIYAGLVLGQNGAPDYHLVLLSEQAEKINWKDALNWAEIVKGSLPTRQEQSILFGNLKHEFECKEYWSCEQQADHSEYAWLQHFYHAYHGYQLSTHKSNECRARAVRRIYLEA